MRESDRRFRPFIKGRCIVIFLEWQANATGMGGIARHRPKANAAREGDRMPRSVVSSKFAWPPTGRVSFKPLDDRCVVQAVVGLAGRNLEK